MDGLEESARAQIQNIEAAMREQLASFRANASQTGTLTDDVMGTPPPPPPLRTLPPSLTCHRSSTERSGPPAGFYYAINWSETWLRVLLAFHVFVWLFAIVTRKANEVQMVLLLSIRATMPRARARPSHHPFCRVSRHAYLARVYALAVGLIYCAERLNRLASENWKEFALQNYFDERGVFVSVMLSAPLLCVAFFILLNALRGAATLLIEVKKLEFKQDARKKAKAAKKDK